jgi:hypothetical protein
MQSAWLAGILGVCGIEGNDADLSDLEIDDDDDDDDLDDWNTEMEDDIPLRPDISELSRQGIRNMPDLDDDDEEMPSSRAGRGRPKLGEVRRTPEQAIKSKPTIKSAPPTIPDTVSDSLTKATEAETPRGRHGPLIGLMAQEKRALEEADSSGNITDLPIGEAPKGPHTLGSMFSSMAKQMSRMERLLVSELAEGNVGAEIMQRAISINPMPLPGSEADEYIKGRLQSLEEQFGDGEK